MSELERYGVIPRHWYFDENREGEGANVLTLLTDVGSIALSLSPAQAKQLKDRMEFYRKHVGREWRDGMLCIPAKERQ